MRGILLAAAALALLMVGSAAALRLYPGNKEFKVFLGAFAAAVAFYAAAFRFLPTDLGFLPAGWCETAPVVDFANGLALMTLIFHGYWTFAYFACLSPSMTVIVSLVGRDAAKGLTADEALALHGGEEPLDLIFRRRLPKLLRGGYVQEAAGSYRLLPRGERVAALGCVLKRLINARLGMQE